MYYRNVVLGSADNDLMLDHPPFQCVSWSKSCKMGRWCWRKTIMRTSIIQYSTLIHLIIDFCLNKENKYEDNFNARSHLSNDYRGISSKCINMAFFRNAHSTFPCKNICSSTNFFRVEIVPFLLKRDFAPPNSNLIRFQPKLMLSLLVSLMPRAIEWQNYHKSAELTMILDGVFKLANTSLQCAVQNIMITNHSKCS